MSDERSYPPVTDFINGQLNLDLLVQVRDQIAAHPELHNQNSWNTELAPCSTRCVAGWATYLTGTYDERTPWEDRLYNIDAAALLGLRVWGPGELGHPFSYQWGHDDTLRNLDVLIDAAKTQEDQT